MARVCVHVNTQELRLRVGERLAEAIEESGVSLAEFSRACGVPYRTLQDYVALKREPRAAILEQVCTRSRISPAWLLLELPPRLRPHDGLLVVADGEERYEIDPGRTDELAKKISALTDYWRQAGADDRSWLLVELRRLLARAGVENERLEKN